MKLRDTATNPMPSHPSAPLTHKFLVQSFNTKQEFEATLNAQEDSGYLLHSWKINEHTIVAIWERQGS